MSLVKLPKKQAQHEIQTRQRGLLEAKITSEINKIKNHKRAVFETARAYPYLSDFIAHCCTDHKIKSYIKKNSAPKSYHYTTSPIPINKFLLHTIYNPAKSTQLTYLKQEIISMFRAKENDSESLVKYIPTTKGSILGLPFIITMEHGQTVHKNLMGKKGGQKEYMQIEIQFLKVLWEDLIKSDAGSNWFPIPKFFFSKIVYFLKNNQGKYGSDIMPIAYRNMFLYFNLIDNSNGSNFKISKDHFVSSVLSQHIRNEKGKFYIKNWYKIKKFIEKGIKLFEDMKTEGLMVGAKIKPQNVYFDKEKNSFQMILRDTNR